MLQVSQILEISLLKALAWYGIWPGDSQICFREAHWLQAGQAHKAADVCLMTRAGWGRV